MNRKNFIKNCGMGCLTGLGIVQSLGSCSGTKFVTGRIAGDELLLQTSEFEVRNKDQTYYKKYIVLQRPELKYPICVYRIHATAYSALWMSCTHQGTELQVFGEKLQCPAHGSEFNMQGKVEAGPAANNLRTFPIIVETNQIRISLKAI